jgi:carbamoyltransferase
LADAATRLARGEVLGFFQGKMEFGPRALGARSILADPRRPEMRDKVNSKIKFRETFRPFAPAVLAAHFNEHFDGQPSPYMSISAQVKSAFNGIFPAITHVDGSARPQVVGPEHGALHELLGIFNEKTGCPLLLNTSFNLRGEPIVLSPLDAVSTFYHSGLDALLMDRFLILREHIESRWEEFVHAKPKAGD